MGRPQKRFNLNLTPNEFEDKVHEYFENEEQPTKAGLLLYCGIGKRKWNELSKNRKYDDAIEYAQAMFQNMYEHQMMDKSTVTGAIFGLKNMGWSDKGTIEAVDSGAITLEQALTGGKMKA